MSSPQSNPAEAILRELVEAIVKQAESNAELARSNIALAQVNQQIAQSMDKFTGSTHGIVKLMSVQAEIHSDLTENLGILHDIIGEVAQHWPAVSTLQDFLKRVSNAYNVVMEDPAENY